VKTRHVALLLVVCLAAPLPLLAAPTSSKCLRRSGNVASRCLRDYVETVSACRLAGDASCEAAARADDGPLDELVGETGEASVEKCTDALAEPLGYTSRDDVALRVSEACGDFSEDLLGIEFADSASGALLGCQTIVAKSFDRLRTVVVRAFGRDCYAAGTPCKPRKRDRTVRRARVDAVERIVDRCDTDFDALALVPVDAAPTLADRVDLVAGLVVQRARHFAQLVYPPNNLGPTAAFGPFPIGVRTLELVDPARMNTTGTGPRPVTVEVYYPSTAAAVAGVPRDIVNVLGVPVATTPAFRDVARADGTFPLVVFSHGNNGIRFQSFFFAAHLASHGFIVATPDHHGNTFVDTLLGVVDGASATNRPLDMSFLIDQLEAFNDEPGNFFAGAIDPDRIGMSGHSFGGYTSFAIAGGSFFLGTFTDPRVKAILPQAPAAPFDEAFFGSITIPTLIIGGSIDETTPFADNQQRPFNLMHSGASVVGLAQLADAGHFTFSDFCEVPRALLGFLGGFDEACEPRHLPWRHAHDIVNYLSLNFFDAVLNGDADALARLSPGNLARIEDLVYQSK
jgi:predicted dienelactone hydrolase